MNTEIRSITGDVGDLVAGGKPEYWVVWDVLKDVEELKSVEFIVRAELISDILSKKYHSGKDTELTMRWSKKRIYIMPGVFFPGPKLGLRLGYMGNIGFSGQFSYGKIAVVESPISPYGTVYTPSKLAGFSLELTKRVVNVNSFQLHFMAGLHWTRMAFINLTASNDPYREEKVWGPEAGLAFGINRFSMSLLVTNIFPGQVEKKSDVEIKAISPLYYFSMNLGVRF
jgi:hypothetical protein